MTLPGVGRIPLRDRSGNVVAWATVDLNDFRRALTRSWSRTAKGYVHSHVPDSRPKAKETLHRFVLGLDPGDGAHADHRDRNRLNNRRENLRVVTQPQNNQNTSGWANASSRYRGVNRARSGRWIASATVGYKRFHLGTFDTEEAAARVAIEFRRTNMPYSVESSAP